MVQRNATRVVQMIKGKKIEKNNRKKEENQNRRYVQNSP